MPEQLDALQLAREVRGQLANHVQITEIKLDGIAARQNELADKVDEKNKELALKVEEKHQSVLLVINELKSLLRWAGGLIVALVITTLSWSLAQQYNSNEAQKKDMSAQLEILREQERARNVSRNEILRRLPPPSAGEASGAASGE